MSDELHDAILDTLRMSVELDLKYADLFDVDALAEEFPKAKYLDPTLYLTIEGRNKAWPVSWLNTTSCGGLYGQVYGFPEYSLRTVGEGYSQDTMVYRIQLEWGRWTLTLWTSDEGDTEVSWNQIESSAKHVLEHTTFPE